jgi:hypothetical protein
MLMRSTLTRQICRLFALAIALPLGVGACGDDDPEPRRSITVSGDVVNQSGEPLPDDTRVVVVWALDDASYVWGGGSVSGNGASYAVELDAPPPEEALFGGAVGIGLIAAIAGEAPAEGEPLDEDRVIGITSNHAVIYVADRDAVPQGALWWLPNMPDGYSVGTGIEREDEIFEGFEPVSPGSIELTIDDLANLHVVNWT